MIYFDYASTTPVDEEVLESYAKLLALAYGNPASSHRLGLQADKYLQAARKSIASLFNISPDEIIFTSGATESTNIIIKGVVLNAPSGHIITSKTEHPSVLNTCIYLQSLGYDVTYLNPDQDGKISLSELQTAIRKETVLVSIQHVNSEVGTIQDIAGISAICRKHGILFHCDIVQSLAKLPIDFSLFDFASVSGHKLFGLKGMGLLYSRFNSKLMPLIHGGGQEFGIRAGTVNWVGAVSLAKTIRLGFEKSDSHLKHVTLIYQYLIENLRQLTDVVINSPPNGSPYIINFSLKNGPGEVVLHALEAVDIIVSTNSACGSKKASRSEVVYAMTSDENRANNAIRISLAHLNTLEEAKIFMVELKKIVKRINKE